MFENIYICVLFFFFVIVDVGSPLWMVLLFFTLH